MKKITIYFLLLILGGLLFSLAWAPFNFFIGAMVGFVPLLMLEERWSAGEVKYKKSKVFFAALLCFATWNASGIWWVWNASWVGVVASVVVNSLFFALIFLLFSQSKKYLGNKIGYLSFVIFWLAWEYIEIVDWDLSWPWLTLGYSLANHTWAIQWYEYTGSLGGSLWILVINLLVFSWVKSFRTEPKGYPQFKRLLRVGYAFFIPVIISLFIFLSHEEKGEKATFIVVQPNIDPYTEKFIEKNGSEIKGLTFAEQLDRMLSLAETQMSHEVDYVLLPETALPRSMWEEKISVDPGVIRIKQWLQNYPGASLISGIVYNKFYYPKPGEEIPADVQEYRNGQFYYQRHNSALFVNASDSLQVYHKSRLVIGVERIPSYFVFLQRYLTEFDDDANASTYNPNHGIQEERGVFVDQEMKVRMGPIICYESIFGEFVNGYVEKGANVLGIITNDGWWGDTPGYQQHFAYARLRAIETRRSVARSANTGWSGFVNQRGDVVSKSEYWVPDVLKETLQLNEEQTFYVRFGDVLGRLSLPIAIMILVNLLIRRLKLGKPVKKQ